MMKYLITLAAILLFYTSPIAAQNEENAELVDSVTFEDNYEDNEFSENELPSANKYESLGLGYVGSFMLYNMDALYAKLKATGFSSSAAPLGREFKLKTPMFVHGFQVFAAGRFWGIDNLRLGFSVTGGSGKDEIELSDGSGTRGIDFAVDYNTLNIDYGIVLWKHVALLPGVGLGWGDANIELYQTAKEYTWDGEFGNLGPKDGNYVSKAEAGFFSVQPGLNIEFYIPETLTTIRLAGGYTFSFMQDWTMNNVAELKNVDKDVNAGGAYFQLGLFFGMFAY